MSDDCITQYPTMGWRRNGVAHCRYATGVELFHARNCACMCAAEDGTPSWLTISAHRHVAVGALRSPQSPILTARCMALRCRAVAHVGDLCRRSRSDAMQALMATAHGRGVHNSATESQGKQGEGVLYDIGKRIQNTRRNLYGSPLRQDS